MFQACEASLRAFGTDWIDIMYLHREDHDTPLEETVRRARGSDPRRQDPLFRRLEFPRLARRRDLRDLRPPGHRPVRWSASRYYNAINRMPEVEHLPACAHYGLGVVPYSPLARGVLTGKYDPDVPPPAGTRAGRQDKRMMQTEWRRESLVIAQEIDAMPRPRDRRRCSSRSPGC